MNAEKLARIRKLRQIDEGNALRATVDSLLADRDNMAAVLRRISKWPALAPDATHDSYDPAESVWVRRAIADALEGSDT